MASAEYLPTVCTIARHAQRILGTLALVVQLDPRGRQALQSVA